MKKLCHAIPRDLRTTTALVFKVSEYYFVPTRKINPNASNDLRHGATLLPVLGIEPGKDATSHRQNDC